MNFCEPNTRLVFVTKPEEFCLGLHFIADALHSTYQAILAPACFTIPQALRSHEFWSELLAGELVDWY